MSFHVATSGTGADEIITLENKLTGTRAEIYVFGALLNAFSIRRPNGDKNVIYGYQSPADAHRNITPLFQSAKLSPFTCRIKEGRYTFGNIKHKIAKYYSHRDAIHGLIFDAVYAVKEIEAGDEAAFVTLTYDYDKTDPGYPFYYRANITYKLHSNNRLTITTKISNLSSDFIPVADGWHPYFDLGKKVDDLYLRMYTSNMVEFDNHLLPTGNLLPFQTFVQPQLIGNAQMDNCFVLAEDNQQPACSLTNKEDGIQVNIYPQENYPFLQVFIPENRASIAIENLSSLPDSFNNAIGLFILESSRSLEFITTYEIEEIQVTAGL